MKNKAMKELTLKEQNEELKKEVIKFKILYAIAATIALILMVI